MKEIFLFCTAAIFYVTCLSENPANISVTDLRCDYFDRPMGIDNKNPKLSWKLTSKEKDQKQIAYRILVSSNINLLNKNKGDIWDTGRIESDRSINVVYQGKRLDPAKKYYWKVCIWDKHNKQTDWSDFSFWETGLLNSSE